jgi:two-component system, sensor histidine kinase PdtaS
MEVVTTSQHEHLLVVEEGIALLADLHRGDILLYERQGQDRVRVVAQARPQSVPPVYTRSLVAQEQRLSELPAVARVLAGRQAAQGPRRIAGHRSHVVQRAFAVCDARGTLVGVLTINKSLVEHERHGARRAPFRSALEDLTGMVLRGETAGMAALSPFRETDGIILVDQSRTITYVSGLASYHYRRLGYSEELAGEEVRHLDSADSALVERAFRERRPFEDERNEEERIWIRKVIPIVGPRARLPDQLSLLAPHGFGRRNRRHVLITVHDATVARRKAQEQVVRQAMVQEIHHRVKNNLQTVASLLRIQARRAQHEETKQILGESINRILSVAVVHEFLSQHEKRINIRDVANRIAQQVREGILDPGQAIAVRVEGDPVFLHAHQTTMLALAINELIMNALEHGFGNCDAGEVVISLADHGDEVRLVVRDTGTGLPEGFTLGQASSLGLRIVQTIVESDLRGRFDLEALEGGTSAVVTFPKSAPEVFE